MKLINLPRSGVQRQDSSPKPSAPAPTSGTQGAGGTQPGSSGTSPAKAAVTRDVFESAAQRVDYSRLLPEAGRNDSVPNRDARTGTNTPTDLRHARVYVNDGVTGCLERAFDLANPADRIALLDGKSGVGHAVIRHPDGGVTDPNTPDQRYPSMEAYLASPAGREYTRVPGADAISRQSLADVFSTPPGSPQREQALQRAGLTGVANVTVANDGSPEIPPIQVPPFEPAHTVANIQELKQLVQANNGHVDDARLMGMVMQSSVENYANRTDLTPQQRYDFAMRDYYAVTVGTSFATVRNFPEGRFPELSGTRQMDAFVQQLQTNGLDMSPLIFNEPLDDGNPATPLPRTGNDSSALRPYLWDNSNGQARHGMFYSAIAYFDGSRADGLLKYGILGHEVENAPGTNVAPDINSGIAGARFANNVRLWRDGGQTASGPGFLESVPSLLMAFHTREDYGFAPAAADPRDYNAIRDQISQQTEGLTQALGEIGLNSAFNVAILPATNATLRMAAQLLRPG